MQTELHRHLDVSLRTSTLLSLAQAKGLEAQSTSLEAFRDKLIMKKPLADLSEVLAQFTLFQKVLDRPEILERIAFEGVEDCWKEGTRKVEFRYSPSFVSEYNGLSWADALQALQRGISRAKLAYPDIQVGLLCIATRDYGPESVSDTVDFFLAHPNDFVGVDLAGNEKNFPCRLFTSSFKKVQDAGRKITIHAGEGSGPENMWEAVELLGASRLGHGIACTKDPSLMKFLAKNQICLEMCPTSNWLTQAVPTLEEHPLPLALRAGIPVCMNTDDPGVFGVTLNDEMKICRERMGMSQNEVEQCLANGDRFSFI